MFQVQVPVGNMPINLILLGNATVAFVRVANFKALFNPCEHGGVDAEFYEADFSIGGEVFQYNTSYPYKEIPQMLQWLKSQNLIAPIIEHF
jgi:hypothetical protein